MQKKIVTISRQYGSGGRYIGKKLSEKLGIPCYDEKLIDMVAKESGFAQDFVAEKGERMTGSLLFNIASSLSFANNVFSTNNGVTLQDEIYFTQNRIIKELADKGPCVIVGRCADYILRDREDCLKVFLYADEETKENRIQEIYGEAGLKLKNRVKDMDVRRGLNYKYFTGQDWGKAQNYDLALNRGSLGIEKCAQLIVDAASEE